MTACILVIGGAGFLGSHMVRTLEQNGYVPVVLDNLSTGTRAAAAASKLLVGEMADGALLERIFRAYPVAAVMHFAGTLGPRDLPGARAGNDNVSDTLVLLDAMVRHHIDKLVFSSSAAVYGASQQERIDEGHPCAPTDRRGRATLMIEHMLGDFERAYGMRTCCLRCFSAVGSGLEHRQALRQDEESHLIPQLLQVAAGQRAHLAVDGGVYDTPDGSYVRDYVDVEDVCAAHLLALQALLAGGPGGRFNLGIGVGCSVLDLVATARQVTGAGIAVVPGAPREGAPARLVADPTLANQVLGWRPRLDKVEAIIEHAWYRERRVPAGAPAGPRAAATPDLAERRVQPERRSVPRP